MKERIQDVVNMLTLGRMTMGESYSFTDIAQLHNRLMGTKTLHGVDVLSVAMTLDIAYNASTKTIDSILNSVEPTIDDVIKDVIEICMN